MLSAPPPGPEPRPLYLRTAVPDDLDHLAALRAGAATWLAHAHGSRQWSDPYDAARGLLWIRHGATVVALLEPDGEPAATVTDRPTGGTRLWTATERARPARYLSRFTVDRRHAGQGIGARLTDWLAWRAAEAGTELLRLNAWTDNTDLHAYYRSRGWRRVRTVEGVRSGALFELPAGGPHPPEIHELGPIPLLR
ncbi:GNAT family N-acetyltransferase [Kitasatospora sp. NPDC097643]|uniref:GNAT family N-acetyltransferase n=1 Tax=Kitasatospora sp. NPDC097643 TaxID=3157230 RepID=UPI00331ECD32